MCRRLVSGLVAVGGKRAVAWEGSWVAASAIRSCCWRKRSTFWRCRKGSNINTYRVCEITLPPSSAWVKTHWSSRTSLWQRKDVEQPESSRQGKRRRQENMTIV